MAGSLSARYGRGRTGAEWDWAGRVAGSRRPLNLIRIMPAQEAIVPVQTKGPTVRSATVDEPGLTLTATQPRTLTMLDQAALWGNLGIGLLGPVTAVYVVAPGMSLLA